MPTLDTRTALSTPAVADLIHVQDVSDTTDTVNGTSKKVILGDLQTLMNSHSNGDKSITFNGYAGNAPWRIYSSDVTGQTTDQVLYQCYNCYYDPASGWTARDVNGIPCIRMGLESYFSDGGGIYQTEWNLDIAPASTGVPSFSNRLYHMNYYYNSDTISWWWRTKSSPSIGGQWDMKFDTDKLQVGSNFAVNVTSGSLSMGNTVTTGSPTGNRTIMINVSGSPLYFIASTSSS